MYSKISVRLRETYLQPRLLSIFIFQPPSWQCLPFLVQGWYLVSVAFNAIMGVFWYHSSHWLLHNCRVNWAQSPSPKTLQGRVVQSWVKLVNLRLLLYCPMLQDWRFIILFLLLFYVFNSFTFFCFWFLFLHPVKNNGTWQDSDNVDWATNIYSSFIHPLSKISTSGWQRLGGLNFGASDWGLIIGHIGNIAHVYY